MPKITKCWYYNCDNDNRQNPKMFFYKFPKDLDRCEKWVRNCANDELTTVWNESPDKVSALRVCQKHFLKEFLGSSSRLVGHAVPAPYGVIMDRINTEKFMVDCANLRSSSSTVKQTSATRETYPQILPDCHQGQQFSLPYYDESFDNQGVTNMYPPHCDVPNPNYSQCHAESNVPDNSYFQVSNYDQQASNPSHMIDLGHSNNQPSFEQNLELSNQLVPSSTDALPSIHDQNQYPTDYQPDVQHMPASSCENMVIYSQDEQVSSQMNTTVEENNHVHQQIVANTATPISTVTRCNHQENPKVNYDRDGNVISIQYSNQSMSLLQTDGNKQNQALIDALKQKLRYYQRKLAVKNHRYQKLKSLTKGRSKKTRLLESLKTCKADFSPHVFEIFKRLIRGPSSKHGNRWSNDVKSFASNIYLRSKSAYKFIRKAIDLPSESIVKRYIDENNLTKSLTSELTDEDQLETENTKSD